MKLLGKGKERLTHPIWIDVSRASQASIEPVKEVGGEVRTVHYNKLALKALLKPEKFEIIPKRVRARPPPKLMLYYTDYEKRGFLAPEMQMKELQRYLSIIDKVEEE